IVQIKTPTNTAKGTPDLYRSILAIFGSIGETVSRTMVTKLSRSVSNVPIAGIHKLRQYLGRGEGLGADDANVLSMGLTSPNLLTGMGGGQKVQFSPDIICECSPSPIDNTLVSSVNTPLLPLADYRRNLRMISLN